ncbi:MAG TPA: phosphate transport system regulatory protein PhoU [Chloroflexi bacterium]|nr:phosphate transport system regulatory protein PhoU [Chloroflexota bacterium]HBY06560.1 phosphate transport system regulatory protein PhoU [Chloroflexota bacterium]
MTRETLDRKTHEILDEILVLGSMVEDAILSSVDSLKKRDIEAAKRIYQGDKAINEKRFAIENDTLILIATQQPMARDLRVMASVLEIASELERMGDYAKGIAMINIRMGNEPLIKPLIDVPHMAEITADMLHRALGAFAAGDTAAARSIPKEDDTVDALYNQVYRELLTFMIKDPSTIDNATFLLWVAHNLERAADRVINICERTLFVETGELVEIKATHDEFES